MARKILLALLVLVVALVAFIATRPDTFHVERSAVIHAPADVVYARLEDFRKWPDWSPWEKLDPAMQRTFTGSDKGVGAVYAWKGNDKVGEGQMTIVEATAPSKLGVRLEFTKPFQSASTTAFDLAPADAGTQVRWTMDGGHNFASKAMCLIMDMDKQVGGDFERGFASLDSVAQADARALAPPDTAAVAP